MLLPIVNGALRSLISSPLNHPHFFPLNKSHFLLLLECFFFPNKKKGEPILIVLRTEVNIMLGALLLLLLLLMSYFHNCECLLVQAASLFKLKVVN